MKTNAIVRICIYSILILLLLGVLISVLLGANFFRIWDRYSVSSEELEPTMLVTTPDGEVLRDTEIRFEDETWPQYDKGEGMNDLSSAEGGLYTATSNVNVRRSPSKTAGVSGMLAQGDQLKISETKTVDKIEWGHVTAPFPGWVCMNYVAAIEAVTTEGEAVDAAPADVHYNYAANAIVNVRTSPTSASNTNGRLDKGAQVRIEETVNANGVTWGHITAPITGWVKMEYVDKIEAVTVETEAVDAAPADGKNAVALGQLDILATPSAGGTVLDTLAPDEKLVIDVTQTVNGTEWGHVAFPVPGWVSMEDVELTSEDTIPESTDKAFSKAAGEIYTVITKVNYRSSPTHTASVLGQLQRDERIKIDAVQNVNGAEWGHVTTTSTPGWVVMDYVELAAENSVVETTVTEEIGPPILGGTFVSIDQLTEISIDWGAGDVIIRRGNTKDVNVVEDAPDKAKPMVCVLKDNNRKLDIQFQESRPFSWGFNFGSDLKSKDLIITVPMDFDLRELDIDMASGEVRLEGLTIDEIELDCADVACILEDCAVRSLDVDTASGDIRFTGSLEELDLDSASADFVGTFTNTPRSIDMDGMSGALDITLPDDKGFSAKVDGMSCRFTSDYPTTTLNGAYVYGEGFCRINADGMSAEVIVRKAK